MKASNFLGYGSYSTSYSFVPRTVPSKPPSSPSNRATLTTSTTIYIEYDAVVDTGGSAITSYNVYVDDGLGGAYTGPHSNALLL